jgi:hypothetical protein
MPGKPGTVRYRHDGGQRARSFATKREADDFRSKFEHGSRAQAFVDPKLGNERFCDAADRRLQRHAGTPKSRSLYGSVLHVHVRPAHSVNASGRS